MNEPIQQRGRLGMHDQNTTALKAISWESEVLAKASEGYGSLDQEPAALRYAAKHVVQIYLQLPE